MPILRFILVAILPMALLSACASLPEDRGMGDVQALGADRTTQSLPTADSPNLSTLFANRLTPSDAVRIALINNPRLRADYARVGIAAAEVYNAGRLSNPRFGVAIMYSDEHSTANQVTFGLTQSFTDLLLLPARSRLAQADFERAKLEVGAAIIDFAADTEEAYFRLVGAQQVAAMRANVEKAAQVSADLAQRFFDAGNISALELALSQSAASQARLVAMRAAADVVAARNSLNRLMGLKAGDTRWATLDQLQLPEKAEDNLDDAIALAWHSRLDLAAKKAQLTSLADSLGVSRQFRYLGDSEIGLETERETDRSRLTGPNLSIELPIFNSGAGRVARAEALVDQAEAELQALTLDIGNEVQLAHAQVQASRALFEQYRDSLVPQSEAVVQLTQEKVSFMLEGPFQLLLVKQQEFEAYQGYLQALRDYWIARTHLQRAVGSRLPSSSAVVNGQVGPTTLPDSPAPGMQLMHHSAMPDASHHTNSTGGKQ